MDAWAGPVVTQLMEAGAKLFVRWLTDSCVQLSEVERLKRRTKTNQDSLCLLSRKEMVC